MKDFLKANLATLHIWLEKKRSYKRFHVSLKEQETIAKLFEFKILHCVLFYYLFIYLFF